MSLKLWLATHALILSLVTYDDSNDVVVIASCQYTTGCSFCHTSGCLCCSFRLCFVEVVAIKQLLDGVSTQSLFTRTNCISIFPFLIIDVVRVKIVNLDVWQVRGSDFLLFKSIPVESMEPHMLFELRYPLFISDSHWWVSHETLVDEISSFWWPALWDLMCFYLHLFR